MAAIVSATSQAAATTVTAPVAAKTTRNGSGVARLVGVVSSSYAALKSWPAAQTSAMASGTRQIIRIARSRSSRAMRGRGSWPRVAGRFVSSAISTSHTSTSEPTRPATVNQTTAATMAARATSTSHCVGSPEMEM